MPSPLLSIGMIVKNEIRSIEKCLKALQPLRDAYPCELVIADTGSNDGTRELAEKYADILFDFPWIDDFAAARNAVMERCSGQWYFSVDADEYLDQDLSGFRKLFNMKSKSSPDLCGVTIRNYTCRDIQHSAYTDMTGVRIAKLGNKIRYRGIIHEALYLPDHSRGNLHILPQILLHHDGYAYQSEEDLKRKSQRNLELLNKQLSENPEDVRCLIECIESAQVFPMQMIQYAILGMELLRKPERTQLPIWDGILAARCTAVALFNDLPQAEEWLAWCMERYLEITAVRVDAIYAATLWYFKKNNSNKVISLGRSYLDALRDLRAGHITPIERISTVFQNVTDNSRDKILILLATSLKKVDKASEAFSYLSKWALERIPVSTAKDLSLIHI